jgi:hypothetical protein
MEPGHYRIAEVRAPGSVTDGPGRRTPDLTFPLWERSLGLGFNGLSSEPTARGRLDGAVFDLKAGDVYYLGHLELSFQKDAFEDTASCLTRESLIRGVYGELYLSSHPVGTRLCMERRLDEQNRLLGEQ